MRNKRKRKQTKWEKDKEEKLFQTSWDGCFVDNDEDRICGPATGNAELDDDEVCIDDDDVIDSIRGEGAGGGEGEGDSSSARVPDPRRYSFPRHLIVDEPVNALK